MKSFERWTLQAGPRGPELHLDQGRNVVVNLFFGAGLVAAGMWFVRRPDFSGLGVALLLFGAFWLLVSVLAGRDARIVRLGHEEIARVSRGGKIRESWPRSRPAAVEIRRKPGRRGRARPLPWEVDVVDAEGLAFKATFRFQEEEPARSLAAELAEMLEVPVREGEEAGKA